MLGNEFNYIRTAINELEAARYIKRTMLRGNDGKIIRMEYEIFEEPYNMSDSEEQKEEKPCEDNTCTVNLSLNKPSTENPSMDLPVMVKPLEENPWVNNTKSNKKENNNILYNNIQSNPIPSKNKISFNMSEIDRCRWDIKDNIEYDILVERDHIPRDMLAAIFNAPNTIGSYFTTRVNYDLYGEMK